MNLLEKNFILSFVTELNALDGSSFEYLCSPILSLILKDQVEHKGHNLYAKPVGYTADFLADNYKVVGQCGTEDNYFEDYTKPIHDISRAIANHPKCESIYLFSNQRATGGKLTDLDDEIKKKKLGKTIHTYDAEKIAKTVLGNINATTKIEEILEYLPKTKEYYKILPQTNKLPSFKAKYFEREEEGEILELLDKKNVVQVYGISGIGKTEVSISVATKLREQFDSIIWLDGNLLKMEDMNLSSVHIAKFNSTINLGYFIEKHKVLLIIDNLNENVDQFTLKFQECNKLGSKCIITSLIKNLPNESSYNLSFLDDGIAKQIITNCEVQPDEDQIRIILDTVKGYPLILNLMKSAVESRDFTWGDIVKEINLIGSFEDSKGEKISRRIIGKFKESLKNELGWLSLLNNTIVSRQFLGFTIGKTGETALEKRSLMSKQDAYHYKVHQLVLDSIKSEIPIEDTTIFYLALQSYLIKFNEVKSIEYYKFLLTHRSFVRNIYDKLDYAHELKGILLYSIIQSSDFFHEPNWLINEFTNYQLEPESNYTDLLLLIEKCEIELFQLKRDNSKYGKFADDVLVKYEEILKKTNNLASKRLLLHHIGKLLVKKRDFESAKIKFEEVLKIVPDADYVLLQQSRILLQEGNIEEAKKIINKILDKEINLEQQSLAILLSFYEMLSDKELADLRKKHIDDKLEFFTKVILQSLDENFEHPYRVIERLSGHLSYMLKDQFKGICETLPFPANIESNKQLMMAYATIQLAFYKLVKFSSIENKEQKMREIFDISEKYFLQVPFENDTERKKLLDLYIAANEVQKAEGLIESFADQENPFFLQNLCKFYRQNNDLPKSLSTIDKAIVNGDGEKKFHKAAFLNDKAETLYAMNDKECIVILQEAINLQNTQKTIDSWREKLDTWSANLN